MNRKKKVFRNIILISILLLIYTYMIEGSIDPIRSYRLSEESLHYGPSTISHIEKDKDKVYILGKYDRWISFRTIERKFLLWRDKGGSVGVEIDRDIKVVRNLDYIYGIKKDDDIDKIKIVFEDGRELIIDKFYDNMFYSFIDDYEYNMDFEIIGYSRNNEVYRAFKEE